MPRRKITMLNSDDWSDQSSSAQARLQRAREAYRKKAGIVAPLTDLWCTDDDVAERSDPTNWSGYTKAV